VVRERNDAGREAGEGVMTTTNVHAAVTINTHKGRVKVLFLETNMLDLDPASEDGSAQREFVRSTLAGAFSQIFNVLTQDVDVWFEDEYHCYQCEGTKQ